ncbi:retrovirus-related pol polyprotein from transposon TNT 1-94 [Tanacetum coccineum]
MQQSFVDEYNETLVLKAELAKKHDMIKKAIYNELSKRCSHLKNWCISLEIKLQQSKDSFQNNRPSHNQDSLEFKEFFIINELQAQLKAKNVSIEKLKEHIANIKGKNVVNSVQNVHNSNVVTSKTYKLDVPPLSPCIKNNMAAHELLVYISATCPSTKHVSDKLVAVTPMNRIRKVRFAESNDMSKDKTQKQVQPQEKQTTNNSMSPSIGVSSSTEASGLKPRPMRVESINGKKYILVIVDYYSRFTWVKFLRSKDEAPEVIIKCLKQRQVCMNATARTIRTDNGTKFVNQTLKDYYENVKISHQTSIARTP